MKEKMKDLLVQIYGEAAGLETAGRLEKLLPAEVKDLVPPDVRGEGKLPLDETDAFIITYGDSLKREGEPGTQNGMVPLGCLKEFADGKLKWTVSGIHILPFFPYSSDDGFSVIDYYKVNPEMGTWDDIRNIGKDFKLMSDLVLNHCSAKSEWFERFQKGEPKYRNFFFTADPDDDLSAVFRPRTHPLLTPFKTAEGIKHVWTTFSADQVDLNFAEPEVLLEMFRVLFYHIRMGIQVIRLDAIAFLWKEIGHTCLHHEKTHLAVKLFRAVLEEYAPWVVLLTETNVPHKENISYFGDGTDEAHMVYNFSLPPLTLDAFLRQDAGHLRAWAAELPAPDGRTTFFNFLASHDGIGVLPAHGILSEEELSGMVESVIERKGRVNYKATPSGQIPYELNITWLDAVAEKTISDSVRARKFLASQAVMLSLPGVPGIYINSLIGSGNWEKGIELTGMNRSINRQKLPLDPVLEQLNTPGTLRNRIIHGYLHMLSARRESKAFHPAGAMEILPGEGPVLALVRTAPDGDLGTDAAGRDGSARSGKDNEKVLCMINTGVLTALVEIPKEKIGYSRDGDYLELISGRKMSFVEKGQMLQFQLEPFGVYWITRTP